MLRSYIIRTAPEFVWKSEMLGLCLFVWCSKFRWQRSHLFKWTTLIEQLQKCEHTFHRHTIRESFTYQCCLSGPEFPEPRGCPEGWCAGESVPSADGYRWADTLQEHIWGQKGQSESVPEEPEWGEALGFLTPPGVCRAGSLHEETQNNWSKWRDILTHVHMRT